MTTKPTTPMPMDTIGYILEWTVEIYDSSVDERAFESWNDVWYELLSDEVHTHLMDTVRTPWRRTTFRISYNRPHEAIRGFDTLAKKRIEWESRDIPLIRISSLVLGTRQEGGLWYSIAPPV
jgi:hypothetical protein